MDNNPKHNRSIIRALSLITQIGITMLVPIVLCFFIGRWLDEKLGTGFIMIIMITLLMERVVAHSLRLDVNVLIFCP